MDLEHAGIAFFMVVVAGLATCLGASAVFFQSCVKLASKRALAASLGFSGGIMLYVSFIEIFQKAKTGFSDAGFEEKYAYMLSTASLFAGMLLMRLLIALTHLLDPDHERELEKIESITAEGSLPPNAPLSEGQVAVQVPKSESEDEQRKRKRLWRMGISTALAMTIHNVPEGLAGMVAGLNDPSVGFTLTLAIAIHNIPEGLCIALPIYYSKGSRLHGFLLATLSGLAEPLGALIAWAIVAASKEDMYGTIYGVLFGVVAGIMIILVLMELIPTAHRYDPKDSVVTPSVAVGMLVMATSLVLFMV
mmetsp:Transcript_7894/g.13700  ORF Transcript_7894/g.13700 Transcript_7894/m.13700 type:complete len:306 (-) Transcript_7894:81-998(-)